MASPHPFWPHPFWPHPFWASILAWLTNPSTRLTSLKDDRLVDCCLASYGLYISA
jgi:hypothetical protein